MLILITGGSGSGKSAYAEQTAAGLAKREAEKLPLVYIATMYPFDEESRRRIERHRKMRKDKQFTTIERYTGLKETAVPRDAVVLLECLSNLTANELYGEDGAGGHAKAEILEGVFSLAGRCRHLVIVSNEIFSDGISYEAETDCYLRCLASVNRQIAARADRVTEVVCGIPLTHRIEKEERGTL